MTTGVGCVRCIKNVKGCRFDGLAYAKWVIKKDASAGVYPTLLCDIHDC